MTPAPKPVAIPEWMEQPPGCGLFLVWLVLLPVRTVWRGYAIATLWLWFVVPFGAPVVAWWQVMGLLCLADTIKGYRPNGKTPPAKEYVVAMVCALTLPAVELLIGLALLRMAA
jgi:hypothetical protein